VTPTGEDNDPAHHRLVRDYVLAAGTCQDRTGGDADILRISLKTVEMHRASAMCNLVLNTTAVLIRYAIRNKFVEA
jgi:hypothetical protein